MKQIDKLAEEFALSEGYDGASNRAKGFAAGFRKAREMAAEYASANYIRRASDEVPIRERLSLLGESESD